MRDIGNGAEARYVIEPRHGIAPCVETLRDGASARTNPVGKTGKRNRQT